MGVVGTSETWDSNIFRLNDSAGPKSDRVNATYVGLRVDKPYAQQRVQLDVTETANHYKTFSISTSMRCSIAAPGNGRSRRG